MIYTVTINPAIDKILFLDTFQRSKTNRLDRTVETIGGKGTHVSINLNLLGVKNTALGIALGENGHRIIQHLRSLGVEEKFLHFEIQGMDSRTNYEIVESNGRHCTMLTEKGPVLPKRITDELIDQIRSLLLEGDSLILTGDASNVEDADIYYEIAHLAHERSARVFLDASGKYLKRALRSHPYLIKPNLEELSSLANRPLGTIDEIVSAIQELDPFKIPVIAMTWSLNGAVLKYRGEIYRVQPVDVNAVNEAGCGDAFLAALVAGIAKSEPMIVILKTAAAVAAATAESEFTVGFDPLRAGELTKNVLVEMIPC